MRTGKLLTSTKNNFHKIIIFEGGLYLYLILFFMINILFIYNIYANEVNKPNQDNQINEILNTNNIDTVKDAISKINKPKSAQKKYKFQSLMFSEEELKNIQKVLKSKNVTKKKKPQNKSNNIREIATFGKIYLSSILYLSEDKWSIWVNGNKLSSTNNIKSNDIYVESVAPYEVNLIWSLSPIKWRIISELPVNAKVPAVNDFGQVEFNIKLKSNQTYILKHDRVVNGKI
tara:strand:- start:6086 stop:6778 length:693 start_codon:yes stop_codon:yes gene_type:complete